jgi:hypothetical protein
VAKAQIPVGYSKAEVMGIYGPATWANVFYLDTSPSNPEDPADAAQAAYNAMHALYETFHSSEFSDQWQVTKQRITYRADEDSIYSFTIADAILGTHSGDAQDAQVAYLINWVSGDSRKGGKPRNYICGVPNASMLDSARLQPTVQATLNGFLSTWLGAFPYAGSSDGVAQGLVEMSFVTAGADEDPPIARPIVSGLFNTVVATQRRRVDRLR